jgi:flagellar biogenesis protein FliO
VVCGVLKIRLQEEVRLFSRSDAVFPSSLSSRTTPKMNSCHTKSNFASTCFLATAVVVSICCCEGRVFAQGDFGGLRVPNVFAQGSQAATPVPQPTQFQQAINQAADNLANHANDAIERLEPPPVLSRPNSSQLGSTWPDKPVKFDDFVRQTNLEQSDASKNVNGLIGSTVDSAGQLLGSWKDKIGQKTNQLLGDGSAVTESAGSVGQDWFNTIKQKANSPDVRRMLGSLALVVGGYLALVVVLRKFNGGGQKGIPAEVVSVLGNLPYGHKQNLRLVRLGSKLVLLLNGPEGTHPIGEITDPGEVEYLAALCQGKRTARPSVPSTNFRQAEQTIQTDSGVRGITDERLAQVINRLEQATRGGTANYEA